MRFNLCKWFGEISSCSCLTVLPGPAWVGSCITRFAKNKSHLCTVLQVSILFRGHVHMMSAVGEGEGGTPKADAVREVA